MEDVDCMGWSGYRRGICKQHSIAAAQFGRSVTALAAGMEGLHYTCEVWATWCDMLAMRSLWEGNAKRWPSWGDNRPHHAILVAEQKKMDAAYWNTTILCTCSIVWSIVCVFACALYVHVRVHVCTWPHMYLCLCACACTRESKHGKGAHDACRSIVTCTITLVLARASLKMCPPRSSLQLYPPYVPRSQGLPQPAVELMRGSRWVHSGNARRAR